LSQDGADFIYIAKINTVLWVTGSTIHKLP